MAGPAVKSGRAPAAAALVQLDEAFHLLRRQAWRLAYAALGSMPFGLGLLYFWSDMSRSAFALERCAAESLLLAVLYVWMKVWQSRFMTALYAEASGGDDRPWSPGRYLRAAAQQAAVQSTAPVVLLLASLPVLPSAWCIAFYQNALLYGNGERRPLRDVGRLSWAQARYEPLQNHVLLAVLTLLALILFLELLWAMLFLPELLRAFTGTETVFTRSGLSVLNSTLFAVAGVLCYAVLDPLIKAVYVLRCFRSEAERTGADLLLSLRQATARRRGVGHWAAVLLVGWFMALTPPAPAATRPDPPPSARPMPPADLKLAIRRTLEEPRYSWRLPRTRRTPDDANRRERGVIGRFLDQVRDWLRRAAGWCRDLARDLVRWLRRVLRVRDPRLDQGRDRQGAWRDAVPYAVVALTVLVLAGLGLHAWRARRRRGGAELAATATAAALPDPSDDGVTADQHPHDHWLDAARDLLARGELRLGLRAAYLASLALLGERRLLTIARHKSNLDYRRELARRAGQHAEVIGCFVASVRAFDRVWYGSHPADRDQVESALADLERMRAALER